MIRTKRGITVDFLEKIYHLGVNLPLFSCFFGCQYHRDVSESVKGQRAAREKNEMKNMRLENTMGS